MAEKIIDQNVCLKQYITEKEYREIGQLAEICYSKDKTILKLELDYKLNMVHNSETGLKEINEFLCYSDDVLAAYLGITCYGGGVVVEINGMTHPDFRRKGLFRMLYKLAMDECRKRSFSKLLLLTDGNSNSGIGFVNSVNAEYDFSEYRMLLLTKLAFDNMAVVNLRKAGNTDGKEISRHNALFFHDADDCECFPEEDEKNNIFTYMIELKGEVIGKINVSFSDNSAFIFGFGILPDFRGKGYGKAALKETLHLINSKNIYEAALDVECKNNTALNLYKACGFEEKQVMNYYRCKI